LNYAYRLCEDPGWVRTRLLHPSRTSDYRRSRQPPLRPAPAALVRADASERTGPGRSPWLTPGLDWRAAYADWPEALGKLEYCDHVLKALGDREPLVSADDPDVDVSEVEESLDQFYDDPSPGAAEFPPGLDGELRAIFEDPAAPAASPPSAQDGCRLIRRYESSDGRRLPLDRTPSGGSRLLLRHLAKRADRLQLRPGESKAGPSSGSTTLVCVLAMNPHTGISS
jgi:hypothetical protein